jgi:hypothetical protein
MLFKPNAATTAKAQPPRPEGDTTHHALRHRDRMAGLWAAELLGLIGQAAQDYAHDLMRAQRLEDDPEDPVAHRLARDLNGKVGIHEIRAKLAHLLHDAKRQLLDGNPRPPA